MATASLMPLPKYQAFANINGVLTPINNGYVYAYIAGTNTLKDTFTTAEGTTANDNPVRLNARGEASIYLGSGSYDIKLCDADNVEIWKQLNVRGSSQQRDFATYADQLNFTGLNNGESVNVLGYDSVGDGGAKQYYWSSSSLAVHNGITVRKPTSVSGAGRWIALNSNFINVLQAGCLTDGSDASVMLQAALDTGATVWIPPTVNISLANPVTMSTAGQHLIIDGTLTSTVATNKVVNVSGLNCKITGTGSINSPAVFDGTTGTPTYAIIWITANFFTLKGITFNNVPRVALRFEDCTNGNVSDCIAFGNFPLADFDAVTATTTTHNFISANPPAAGATDDSLIISNNYFYQFISAIASADIGSASSQLSIQINNNRFVNCLDHGTYLRNSNGAIVSNNNFYNCYSPIIIDGNGSIATGNTLYEDGTFANRRTQIISIRSGDNCIVSNNTIIGKGAAIDCSYVADNPDITNNTITDNIVIQTEADNARTPFCLRVYSSAGVVSGNNVTDNTLVCKGSNALSGAILIAGNATYDAVQNIANRNRITVSGSIFGITETLGTQNIFDDNVISYNYDAGSAVTLAAMHILGGSTSAKNNTIRYLTGGTNVSIRGIQIASGNTGTFGGNKFELTSASLTAATGYFNSGVNTNFVSSKQRIERTAAPTTGTWAIGDIVYNSAPAAAGFIGWVCTNATGSGTWKTWGVISA